MAATELSSDLPVLPEGLAESNAARLRLRKREQLIITRSTAATGRERNCTSMDSREGCGKPSRDAFRLVSDAAGTCASRKDWQVEDFLAGIEFFSQVADVAEAEGHHPDLHLESYRNLWIEWTHAIGGLTENDFILAAKIDQLPIRLRQ